MNTWRFCWFLVAISIVMMVGRGISEIEAHEELINVLIDLVEPLADKSFALQSLSTS